MNLMDKAIAKAINGIAISDRVGRLIYVNTAFLKMWKHDSDSEVLGRLMMEFWLNQDEAAEIVTALHAQSGWIGQMTARRSDGTQFDAQVSASAIRDDDGTNHHMMTSIVDITERKRSEARLHKQAYQMHQILDSIYGFVGLFAPDGKVIDVNRAPLVLAGLKKSSVVGEYFWETPWWQHDESAQRQIRDQIRRAAAGEMVRFDTTIITLDGSVIDVDGSFSPLHDNENRVTGIVGFATDITSRKKADEELRNSRDLTDAILANANALIVVLDHQGRIQRFNTAAENLSGYRAAEVIGKFPWETVLPPEDDARIRHQSFQDPTDIDQRVTRYTNHWLTRSGELRLIDWHNSTLLDQSGCVRLMIAIGIDITERSRMEDALTERERRLRIIVESEPECIKVLDREGRLLEMNPAGLRMVEAEDLAQIRNACVMELIVPEYRKAYQKALNEAFEGKSTRVEFEIVGLQGTRRRLEQQAVPLHESENDGQISEVLAVARDITDQTRSQIELAASESRLREAQRIGGIGNWELDLITGELTWSDQIFSIFEIDKDRFVASYEAFLDAVHPDDRDLVNNTYSESVEKRCPYEITHRLLMKDGRVKYVQERGKTFYSDDDQKPLRSVGTVQDITTLQTTQERLEASLTEKETLLREMHHRVKNNLQIISSLLHFQSRKLVNPRDAHVFAEGRDRLRSMILVHEQLYRSNNLSRIEFLDYLLSLTQSLSVSYGNVSAHITISVEGSEALLPIEIALPCGMLATEVISNAFKYAFAEGRRGHLRIVAERNETNLHMRIADDGVGLGDNVDPAHPTGFGLTLVQNLADQLGATLRFERNGGVTVIVDVPLQNRQAEGRSE